MLYLIVSAHYYIFYIFNPSIMIRFSILLIAFLAGHLMASAALLTLSVDMSNEVIGPSGVYVAGSFQDWNPETSPMIDLGDGIYSLSFEVEADSVYQYVFLNGIGWDGREIVPEECGVDNGLDSFNRSVEVLEDVQTPLVCFGSCATCVIDTNTVVSTLTVLVDMSNETIDSAGVHVAGTFQGWDETASPMFEIGEGLYAFTTVVDSGSTHQYKFINGNVWENAEMVSGACGVDDGLGGYNRVATVDAINVITEEVCFGSCLFCMYAPDIPQVNLTLLVDMSEESISENGVHIAGSFQNWNPMDDPMFEIQENIFAYSTLVDSGSIHQYKFINGNAWADAEMVPAECGLDDGGGILNREIVMGGEDLIVQAPCFANCFACPMDSIPTDTMEMLVNVTFSVDMSLTVFGEEGVLVEVFDGNDIVYHALADVGNSIYEKTVALDATLETVWYRFINGDVSETVPMECGDEFNIFYRICSIPMEDTVLETVCFSQCSATCEEQPTALNMMSSDLFDLSPMGQNQFLLNVYTPNSLPSILSIFSLDGRFILHETFQSSLVLDASSWTSGVYLVRLQMGGRLVVQKIVVD